MIIKKLVKLTPKKISSWLTSVIIIIALLMLFFVSLFLYKNFYQVITQTKEILILKDKMALDTVDMEKFNSIIDKLTNKTAAKELKDIVSPFH